MGNGNLQKIALATEIVAGVAVVFTLGLLVYETRQNTNSIQAQTYQALQSELNEYRRMFVDREYSAALMSAQEELRQVGFENLSR